MDEEENVDVKTTGVVTDGEKASDVVVTMHTTNTTNSNETVVVAKAKTDIALDLLRRLRLCRCWYRSLPPTPSLLLKLGVTTAVVVLIFAARERCRQDDPPAAAHPTMRRPVRSSSVAATPPPR